MITFPNAKINLGLHVLRKLENNFHEIETCIAPICWNDIIEIIPNSENKVILYGKDFGISNSEDNLCFKALKVLQKDFGFSNVNIHLYKSIPVGAGLGGGSADAAFTLKVLNNIFKLNISDNKLKEYASFLGADCPFFIDNKIAFATGIGTTLNKIDLDIDFNDYVIAIIFPNINISTAEAYSLIKPNNDRKSIKEILKLPITNWKNNLTNDFETEIFKKYPALADIKNYLYSKGAIYSAMSGSGSAMFGIFEKDFDFSLINKYNYKLTYLFGGNL